MNQAPPTDPTQHYADSEHGASKGLGCVTGGVTINGVAQQIAACTYDSGPTRCGVMTNCCPGGNPKDLLVIYDSQGNTLYGSDCLFDGYPWESVPIISSAGDVWMSDDATVARISPDPMTGAYPSPGGSNWCMNFTLENTMTGAPSPAACGTSGTPLAQPPGASISPILLSNGTMIVFGLAISNGLVALSGALLAQYQGFADVQMGIGMVVWGLASVIIGEALVGTNQLGLTIIGAVMGSVLFRLMVAVALRWGLSPNDLKLITAVFVFCALIVPQFLRKARLRSAHA